MLGPDVEGALLNQPYPEQSPPGDPDGGLYLEQEVIVAYSRDNFKFTMQWFSIAFCSLHRCPANGTSAFRHSF